MVEVETATFWRDSPEVTSGAVKPEDIGTEVFLFPAAGHAEKDGTFTNTQGMLQWHEKAVDPPGDCRSDGWFVYHLGRRLKARAEREPDASNAGLRALTWDYPTVGPHDEPDMSVVLGEINGRRVSDGEHVGGFADLAADGSTACGCWIYAGVAPEAGVNRARDRAATGPYGQGWGWAWPADRRILYNRASARPDGQPWSEKKKLVWWDEARGEWSGLDTPDFPRTTPPGFVPAGSANTGRDGAGADAARDPALGGDTPFIMHDDGLGWLFVPNGLKDGPLPAHYEPLESPERNVVYGRQTNPAASRLDRDDNRWADSPDEAYPYVLTTYRLTEHHTAGGMSRTLSRLAELQPALFCEISPELGDELRVRNGERVHIVTARGRIEAHALVTPRMRPIRLDGRVVHQVALPWHFGHRGLVAGDVANDLVAMSEEPNVRIMETKALVCRLERAASTRQGKDRND